MPFKSAKQMRYLYARHPEIAKRWMAEYGKPQPKKTLSPNPGKSARRTRAKQ